jgi:uncharacterized protein YeaO (DUF488 family)
MPVVKIKRIYERASKDDGKRILVDRLWPRGIKKDDAKLDEWLRDIAPSDSLRKWFAHDPKKWHEFKERYKKELKDKADIIARLEKDVKQGDVTLLYSARDEEHNNAVALMETLK